MKLYKVKATEVWEYVIEVDEHEIPEEVAKKVIECSREYDSKGAVLKVGPEIKNKSKLPGDWNTVCLPWGTNFDRQYTIRDVLDGE